MTLDGGHGYSRSASPTSTKLLCVTDVYQLFVNKRGDIVEHKARNNLKLNITYEVLESLIGISQGPVFPLGPDSASFVQVTSLYRDPSLPCFLFGTSGPPTSICCKRPG